PQMRGSFRSRPMDDIVAEARMLADLGKRELILVSQEATLYGADRGKVQILPLLDELQKIDGIEWIRLMYLHPQMVDVSLISYLSEPNKTLPYYDLPLQHINNDMLKRMRRQVRRPKIEEILAEIRERRPDAVIRTTFIVGFPGETEEQFSELYQFAEEFRFDRMGAFAYSNEEGSSAAIMPDQIPEEVKTERVEAIEDLQNDIASENNQRLIGAQLNVLVDSAATDEDPALGRTAGDCPDVDQIVYIREQVESDSGSGDSEYHPDSALQVGQFCRVKVLDTVGLDLITERVSAK
ncbi:MiaB/RimO family radical SAM methylthiotransferase, partial [Gemmatimonas aurantiaca]|nr:MiaB/RimO family radical SAM methylthiotransferase [Gemmatimonas aurantiaca]